MWFQKKKEIDPKLRFEQAEFRRELQKARSFKREFRQQDSNRSWFSLRTARFVVGVILILSGVYYILCVPNIFFVKTVVLRSQNSDVGSVRVSVDRFLEGKRFRVFPNRNTLLLSNKNLQEYLLAENKTVLEVESITKKWFSRTLEVAIKPRTNLYLLETVSGKQYVVSNDGKVVFELAPGSPTSGLLKIVGGGDPRVGDEYLRGAMLSGVAYIRDNFFKMLGIGVGYVELAGANPNSSGQVIVLSEQDFIVYTIADAAHGRPEFKVVFDTASNLGLVMENLQLLFSNTSYSRFSSLGYVDMRFKGKGFICLNNEICQKPPVPPPPLDGDSIKPPSGDGQSAAVPN